MAPEELFTLVPDILHEPLPRRGGGIYEGRFQIAHPQWILNPDDLHATATVSVRDVVTAADNGLIWTDQLVQRGIKPEISGKELQVPVELRVSDGYPDEDTYVFYPKKADEIAEKLLAGQPLKLSPLVWNLRPAHFQAAIDPEEDRLLLYRGRIYLPDGHHRHQAILRAFRAWEEAPDDYPHFDPERSFTLDIYFMSRSDEAEYFFQKNWLPQAVERSKSFDLTTQDSLSVLAKLVIEQAPSLTGNVNRVTDRLAASNPQVITLSTLREVMRVATEEDELTDAEVEEFAPAIAQFWEELAAVRPELGRLDVEDRRASRKVSMAGQAVTMYGYAELLRRFLTDANNDGLEAALKRWSKLLKKLAPSKVYEHPESEWKGDFFARDNPLWAERGVLQATKSGGQTISNVRQTREQVAAAVVSRLGL